MEEGSEERGHGVGLMGDTEEGKAARKDRVEEHRAREANVDNKRQGREGKGSYTRKDVKAMVVGRSYS